MKSIYKYCFIMKKDKRNDRELVMTPIGGSDTVLDSPVSNGVNGDTVSHRPKKKDHGGATTFTKTMYAFTQSTTCHGVRFICGKGFLFRRIFWLLVFCTAVCLLITQMTDRIRYYYSDPYNVKVEVNFNHSMKFPVIAICNQNEFKITEAVKLHREKLIHELYGQKLNVTKLLDSCRDCDKAAHPNGCPCDLDITLDKLYYELAHKKEDMIVSCKWNGISCSYKDFNVILTDHGICFEFNGAEDDDKARKASGAGTEHGLQLVINIEQYEYMLGDHDSAGLKILLYSNREVPMVTYLGQGVAPGTRTFVGTTVTVMTRLPLPHGNCTKKGKLKYYAKYSELACKKDCQAADYVEKCKCRQSSLWRSDSIPICTIKNILQCYENYSDYFAPNIGISTEHQVNCSTCESPCHSMFYTPNLSYLKTSNFDVDKNLASLNHEDLLAHFSKARDTTAATDPRTLKKDIRLMTTLVDTASAVEGFLSQRGDPDQNLLLVFRRFAGKCYMFIRKMGRYTTAITKYFGDRRQLVEQLFTRGVQIAQQNSFDEVSSNIARFEEDLRADIVALVDLKNNLGDAGMRDVIRRRWYEHASNLVQSKSDAVARSQADLQRIVKAYTTGEPLVAYPDAPTKTRLGLIPVSLLSAAITSDKALQYLERLKTARADITNKTDSLESVVETAYKSYSYNAEKLNETFAALSTAVAEFQVLQVSFFDDVCYSLGKRLLKTEGKYQELETKFDDQGIREQITQPSDIVVSASNEQRDKFPEFNASLSLVKDYIRQQNPGKTYLARHFTSKAMTVRIADLDNFFRTIRQQLPSLQARFKTYRGIFTVSVLRSAVRDMKLAPDAVNETVYNHLNIPCTDVLEDFSASCSKSNDEYASLIAMIDNYVNQTLGSKDTMFLNSLNTLKAEFTSYLEKGQIDARFYTDNFLSLDVFFREMSYELIEQQPAYDVFALVSDIGGSMGLFVGASVLTLCELLDAVALYFYKRCRKDSVGEHRPSKYST